MSLASKFTLPADLDHRAVRKMGVGFVLGAIMFLLPAPSGLTAAGWDTLVLFALVVYFWATETLPLPVTALLAGVGLVLLGIAEDSNDAWSPYAQDTIFFLLGSLILADGITKTGADRVLASRLLARLGGNVHSLMFAIVAISAVAAALISNHAVAAVMLPLVLSILRSTGLYNRKNIATASVLAIAFGAAIAGLATPSGGSRNIIVLGYLDELYNVRISYWEWTVRSAPITLALIPVVFFLLIWLFKIKNEKLDRDEMNLDTSNLDSLQRRTLWIMGLTVVLWIWKGTTYGLGTVAIIGAALMFMFGVLDWVDTRRRIAWGVPLIYGAALAMGHQMQRTGAVDWLADGLTVGLMSVPYFDGGTVLIVGTLVIGVILTNIMSDGGTAAILAPITLALAAGAGLAVEDVGLITAISASFGYMLVVANPGNVIAYSSGMFTAKDLARVGLPLTIASLVITYLAVTLYWPLIS